MKKGISKYLATFAILGVLGVPNLLFARGDANESGIKIGFVVKDATSSWFQDEWRFAEKAAKEKGFELIKIEAKDGSSLISVFDNLGSQQVQGVIACVPDVKLGPAVVAKAKQYSFNLMTVDDRLLDQNGNAIEKVPHMGISAYNIGKVVGQGLVDEINKRGWNLSETYAIMLTFNELPTLKERREGSTKILLDKGLPKANILNAPQKDQSTAAAFDAANIVIAKNLRIKNWIVYGFNDESVIGGIRALEGNGINADNVIGIGINGSSLAIGEFEKEKATGFFGTVVLSPYRHGYETAVNMYNWIAKGQEPKKLILTSGVIATRANYHKVRKSLGLE